METFAKEIGEDLNVFYFFQILLNFDLLLWYFFWDRLLLFCSLSLLNNYRSFIIIFIYYLFDIIIGVISFFFLLSLDISLNGSHNFLPNLFICFFTSHVFLPFMNQSKVPIFDHMGCASALKCFSYFWPFSTLILDCFH